MHFKKGMRHPAHYKTDEPWKQHAWWKKPDTKGHGTWDSFVPNSRTGTQTETLSRREASRPGSGTGCGPPWLGLVREWVWTAVARPGQGEGRDRRGSAWSGTGCGPPWLGLVREGVWTAVARPVGDGMWTAWLSLVREPGVDRRGSAWVRDGVGTAVARPGPGRGCGQPWIGLGQGGGVDSHGLAWVREPGVDSHGLAWSGSRVWTAVARPGSEKGWGPLWLCGSSHTDAAQAVAQTTQLWEQAEDA